MTGRHPGVRIAVAVVVCLCAGFAVGGVAANSGVGGSAADGPTAERTLNTTVAEPGETVRVTATVTRDSAGPVDYLDEFEPAFADDASLVSLTVNGESVSESLLGEFDDTLLVSVEDVPAGTVTVTYDVAVPVSATPGNSYSFDGLAQTGDGDDEQTSVGGGPPLFEVALSGLPGSVVAGEQLAVEATVTNTGNGEGTQQVKLAVDGESEANTTVTLVPGETASLGFEYTTTAGDTPAVDVAVSSGNETASETVAVAGPASFEVALSGLPEGVTAGTQLSGAAVVTNAGEVAGTQSVTVTAGGVQVTDTQMTLGPGETESVGFEYTPTAEETPELTVAASSANATATETVAVAERAFFAVALPSVPAGATVGTELSVTAVVTNVGGTAGTQLVTITAGGEQVTDAAVTLAPGETESVALTYTVTDSDSPEVDLMASSANETATATVTVTDRALLDVSLTGVPASVAVGEELAVEAVVTNVGGETATQQVGFAVNGQEAGNTTVTLAPDESESVTITHTVTGSNRPELSLAVASANRTATETVTVTGQALFAVALSSVVEPVTAGEALTVETVVTNAGDGLGTQQIGLTVDGQQREHRTATLAPGESTSVTFVHTVTKTNGSALSLAVSSANETVTETITVVEPVLFEVALGSVPETVTAGEVLTVPVLVTNTGEVAGAQSLRFTVDGNRVETVERSLAPGATETVPFEYTVGEEDTTSLTVAAASNSDVATATTMVLSPPLFAVTVASVPASVTVGDPLTVTATVTNTGDTATTQSVTLAVDGARRASSDVELSGGASETVTFEYTPADPGNRALTVASDDRADTTTVTVRATPAFETTLVSLDESVATGETVTGTYRVENTGTVSATRTVRLSVAGDPVANRTLTLGGGEQTTVTFAHTLAVDGPSAVEISAGTSTDTVSATVSVTDPAEQTDGDSNETGAAERTDDEQNSTNTGDNTDDSTGPGFGIATLVLGLLGLAVLAARRSDWRCSDKD